MTIDQAKVILAKERDWMRYFSGETTVQLDGDFSADQLEAVAVLLRAGQLNTGDG